MVLAPCIASILNITSLSIKAELYGFPHEAFRITTLTIVNCKESYQFRQHMWPASGQHIPIGILTMAAV